MYFTNNEGIARFTATLSDNSSTPFSQIFDSGGGNNYPGVLKLDFASNSPGQTLTVTGVLTSGGASSNVAFQAVTLGVPEPSAWMPLSLGIAGLALLAARRRQAARLV